MESTNLRWGIMGTANIAQKNWLAIRETGEGEVRAVASRDPVRSQAFIERCQRAAPYPKAPEALGSYEALLEHPEVDAIYLPLPTGIRKEWVIRAARAGKHVLSEKPCAVTLSDLEEMLRVCREERVQFMDGVMFMHSGRLDRLGELLGPERWVGKVQRVTSQFSFLGSNDFFGSNIRSLASMEPLGCLGDLGWYCLRASLWVMDGQWPTGVSGRVLSAYQSEGVKDAQAEGEGVPTSFSGELVFEAGVSAGFYCSFLTEHQQWLNISGDRGYVHVPDFVLPFAGEELAWEQVRADYVVRDCDFSMRTERRTHALKEASHGAADAQETKMFRCFQDRVRRRVWDEVWMRWAWRTQAMVEACLVSARQGGVMVAPSIPKW